MTQTTLHTRPAALTHFAGRVGDHNDRAMGASPRLASALADRLGVAATVIGSPRPALSSDWSTELEAARAELVQMAEHIDRLFVDASTPVTALSRCAVALATLPAVARHRPDAVVVWFDAHADINVPASTTTSYLGGLALSGPLGLWDSGLGAGLSTENVVLTGVRDIDPPETRTIEEHRLRVVAAGPDRGTRLSDAVAGRPVYIHIDCDVVEPGIVPTDYGVPGGLSLADLSDAAAALGRSEVVGIEIGELETVTGDEDLGPLLTALEPVLRLPLPQ